MGVNWEIASDKHTLREPGCVPGSLFQFRPRQRQFRFSLENGFPPFAENRIHPKKDRPRGTGIPSFRRPERKLRPPARIDWDAVVRGQAVDSARARNVAPSAELDVDRTTYHAHSSRRCASGRDTKPTVYPEEIQV